MKKIIQKIFILFCAVAALSCSDDSVNSNNIPPADENFKYPYRTNALWYYTTRNFVTNLRPDSLNVYFSTDTTTGYGGAQFVKDSVVNGDTLKLLRNSHSTPQHGHTTLEYYKQTDTGLVRLAYYSEGTNFGPYRPLNNNIKLHFAGKNFSSTDELLEFHNADMSADDTVLVFDDPPVLTIKYPIAENSEWNFVIYGTTRITKKYDGFENVTVPAGTYHCAKIRRLWYYNSPTPDPRSISYDYFSKEGMMKRDLIIKDIIVSNSQGQPIGLIDVKEEAEVLSYFGL